ncbi:MAG: DNA alkylation repair protein [Bacteroidales bacterium]|nr:DNA alkylation repair protein [Bacteroidales bacterium]
MEKRQHPDNVSIHDRNLQNLILNEIRDKIKSVSCDQGRISGERFFRESVKIYGAKSADISAISREAYKNLEDKDKATVFALCEDLLKNEYLEESFIACDWAYRSKKYFEKNDFVLFEYWINSYINNWATCDTFCNHTMGEFIDMWPEYLINLKSWTSSPNRWVRRAAAVSLIVPAREGRYKKDIFEIAQLLLNDKDDMVQKGYGWMLKACSKPFPEEVFRFVMERKEIMPRTSLRYAIEKLPEEMKKEAMKK